MELIGNLRKSRCGKSAPGHGEQRVLVHRGLDPSGSSGEIPAPGPASLCKTRQLFLRLWEAFLQMPKPLQHTPPPCTVALNQQLLELCVNHSTPPSLQWEASETCFYSPESPGSHSSPSLRWWMAEQFILFWLLSFPRVTSLLPPFAQCFPTPTKQTTSTQGRLVAAQSIERETQRASFSGSGVRAPSWA